MKAKAKYLLPFLIYECILCYSWPAVVSSFCIPRITRLSSQLRSTNDIDPQAYVNKDSRNNTLGTFDADSAIKTESELACQVLGFYPLPASKSRSPLQWLLKDTHQAIVVTEILPSRPEKATRVRMDFMTKGGANHPVWYNEATKWNVLLGGSIDGEVRVKVLRTKTKHTTTHPTKEKFMNANDTSIDSSELCATPSQLSRLISYANDYDCRMNLYTNNCRIFAARMEREVERLNSEGEDSQDSPHDMVVADIRCALRILWAVILPTLYPSLAVLLLCKGCLIR